MTKTVHIFGVGGTFMSGVALLARAKGYMVHGYDLKLYPPMSTQLAEQHIKVSDEYHLEAVKPGDDIVLGNVLRRGVPIVEVVLNDYSYASGPAWLAQEVLAERHVIAVAGTHGKTTTASLIAWILDYAGYDPGFLIGGIPLNFNVSARLGKSPYFVIEADEYDTACFDKRPKFLHYHPSTLVLNNLEFDHADIYQDLAAIQQQFHYLLRTIPGRGHVIYPAHDANLVQVMQRGCWSQQLKYDLIAKDLVAVLDYDADKQWQAQLLHDDGSSFMVYHHNIGVGVVKWSLLGQHNVYNALAALAAATSVGVAPSVAIKALESFKNVRRRLEHITDIAGISIYEDFGHHPTAIAATLAGLRAKVGSGRIVVLLELGSYTMRSGVHCDTLVSSLANADLVYCRLQQEHEALQEVLHKADIPVAFAAADLLALAVPAMQSGDYVVIMSNTNFDDCKHKLIASLS